MAWHEHHQIIRSKTADFPSYILVTYSKAQGPLWLVIGPRSSAEETGIASTIYLRNRHGNGQTSGRAYPAIIKNRSTGPGQDRLRLTVC